MGERVLEIWVLENVRPIGHCSAGETRKTTIDKGTRSAVPVSPDQVCCAQEVPDVRILLPPQALVGSNSSHPFIFEWRKHPRKQRRRPANIVIRKDSNGCRDMRERLAHLVTFVRFVDAEDPDHFARDGCSQSFGFLHIGVNRDQNYLAWFIL